MRVPVEILSLIALLAGLCAEAPCQTAPMDAPLPQAVSASAPITPAPIESAPQPLPVPAPAAVSPAVQALLGFQDSAIKFSIGQLMDILADKRHEGWVLAAYPDPKTAQPLIGAGFSLDLPAREHPQLDPLNPNPFYEPSSAELWQAAGFAPARLTAILDRFHHQLEAQTAREFRSDLADLPPQITDEEARQLLRVGIVQSVLNARAYCRNFDALTASQQMALTQLVYQMGINLQQFTQFLALINHDAARLDEVTEPALREAVLRRAPASSSVYWRTVQLSLARSQWARLYRERAIAVIAMFDPRYERNPILAERRVGAVLRPVRHRRRHRAAYAERVAGHSRRRRASRAHRARRQTA